MTVPKPPWWVTTLLWLPIWVAVAYLSTKLADVLIALSKHIYRGVQDHD